MIVFAHKQCSSRDPLAAYVGPDGAPTSESRRWLLRHATAHGVETWRRPRYASQDRARCPTCGMLVLPSPAAVRAIDLGTATARARDDFEFMLYAKRMAAYADGR